MSFCLNSGLVYKGFSDMQNSSKFSEKIFKSVSDLKLFFPSSIYVTFFFLVWRVKCLVYELVRSKFLYSFGVDE